MIYFFSTIYPGIEGMAKFQILHDYFFNLISSAELRSFELKLKLEGFTILPKSKVEKKSKLELYIIQLKTPSCHDPSLQQSAVYILFTTNIFIPSFPAHQHATISLRCPQTTRVHTPLDLDNEATTSQISKVTKNPFLSPSTQKPGTQ